MRLSPKWHRATRMAPSATASASADGLPSPARAGNPVMQTNYATDPAPLVHEGRNSDILRTSSGITSEKISDATSDSPTGPWTVRGDVMGACSTFANHPGVVD